MSRGVVLTAGGAGLSVANVIIERLGHQLTVAPPRLSSVEESRVKGVLLLGGGDIDPTLYNEGNRFCQPPNALRDAEEYLLLRYAVEHKLPVLGICRGLQLMTAYFGGNLYQDIFKDRVTYHHASTHTVKFYHKMRDIVPSKRVNSYHHQAINKMPPKFDVMGVAYDDIIESIWKPGFIGVQFHPEYLYADSDMRWSSIFKWFLSGAS